MGQRDNLLLVDDLPANLHALSRVLAGEYELSIATSGAAALNLAREQAPDLILLDVMMPDMDGLETLERLRAREWGRDIPVILVTADDRIETQVRGLELGADDFLTKPFNVPVLQARVRGQLQRKRLRKALQANEANARQQLAFQQIAADVATGLSSADSEASFDAAMNLCLGEMGMLLKVDRCHLMQLSGDLAHVSNTHEWCADSIDPQRHRITRMSTDVSPWLMDRLLVDGLIHLPDASALPAEAAGVRAECEAQGVQSLLMLATRGAKGTLTGAIGCDSVRVPRTWSGTEIVMLQTIAGILGTAIEQRRAALALERQSRYRELIQQLSLSFINLPIDELGDAIDGALARIGRFFDVDRAYVFDYDFDAGTTSNTHEWCAPGISSAIENLQDLPIGIIPEWLAQHRRGAAMLLEDVSALPPGPLREILEPQQIVSLITVPLMYDGACLGYVGVDIVRQPANRIGPSERDLLRLFAELLVSVEKRKQAESALNQAASVFEHANEGIMITDPAGRILDVNAAFTDITGYRRDEVLGKNPRLLNSGMQDRRFYGRMWQQLETEGTWTGELWDMKKSGELFAAMMTISAVRNGDGEVQRYVALFFDITAQKAHERQLQHIAHFDPLTGLPNRVLLSDRIQQAIAQAVRRREQIAVAYLDLDGFKAINDTHGHDVGDRLLVAVAGRMREALRGADTLARLGGDEFVAVLGNLQGLDSSVPLLRRLLDAAAEPVQVDQRLLHVSASLGVSLYPQDESIDADQLLRQADQAMYQAKLAGKNRYHFFDLEHDRSLRGRHEGLERIRQALTMGEFELHYQPKVNMREGAVVGAEALIRWRHPERGLLSPAAFLPTLANHTLMIGLGDWVIETALTQVGIWRAAGLSLPVSVNVDPMQLDQGDFVTKVGDALARHPSVCSGDLELEVVETSALEDVVRISRIIEACQGLGVSFALDDFGTGYSSLTYLKRLPVGMLKIDQSFVRDMLDDPDDLAILKGVIGLANAFRRCVIAEGVESEAHGQMLLQLGCALGQGYAIARPMPAAEIPAWVNQWRPHDSWVMTPLPVSG